jgi:NADH-quinone oxidoreductase subunit G
MPTIHIDGTAITAAADQTVMQAAVANGVEIPAFCWHPQLSIAGNCRICAVQVEGRSWVEIACNMPVSEGLKVLTNSPTVQEYRKSIMQLLTLNHPVDCGICDKAGECTLQDYHYRYNGAPSQSHDPKLRATKFHALSKRIVLDNERCILCSRCVRFTHEISQSHALGITRRGDSSLVRAAGNGALDADPYSDNLIDLCPVGALLSPSFLYKSRVWYLQPTRSVCPGCARGCNVQLWHRRPEWRLHALDASHNTRIERVTPFENPAVNGPWICNKGRDLAQFFDGERALQPLALGIPIDLAEAIDRAQQLIAAARQPVAIVSNWGANEELEAFHSSLGARCASYYKIDCQPQPGEPLEDDLLIRADKNPNTTAAKALFTAFDPATAFTAETDLVLVWGRGLDFSCLPPAARRIVIDAWSGPANAQADIFIPLSLQTERAGHYTNFRGVISAFEPCSAKPVSVADAAPLFAALAGLGASA